MPSATAADVDAAVTAARAALPRWWQTTVAERAGYLRRIRDGPAKRQDQIAETIASERGCPLRTATKIQAALPQTVLAGYADLIESDEFDTRVGNTIVAREPAGVVGAITAWNYCSSTCSTKRTYPRAWPTSCPATDRGWGRPSPVIPPSARRHEHPRGRAAAGPPTQVTRARRG